MPMSPTGQYVATLLANLELKVNITIASATLKETDVGIYRINFEFNPRPSEYLSDALSTKSQHLRSSTQAAYSSIVWRPQLNSKSVAEEDV